VTGSFVISVGLDGQLQRGQSSSGATLSAALQNHDVRLEVVCEGCTERETFTLEGIALETALWVYLHIRVTSRRSCPLPHHSAWLFQHRCNFCTGFTPSHSTKHRPLRAVRYATRSTGSSADGRLGINSTLDDSAAEITYRGFQTETAATSSVKAIKSGTFHSGTVSYTSSAGSTASFTFTGESTG